MTCPECNGWGMIWLQYSMSGLGVWATCDRCECGTVPAGYADEFFEEATRSVETTDECEQMTLLEDV